jgi:hypothetical protein
MAEDQSIRNAIISYLLRHRVAGGHKQQVQTVVGNVGIASHDEGRAKELIDEMARSREAPIERYGGGHRQNIRLSSIDAGVEYLEEHGGDIPFGVG